MENPFRVGGTVVGEFFTNRADEIRRIMAALKEPQAKLLVYGPRRMGKSSVLETCVRRLESEGKPALMADLSATTTVSDMATRILQAAVRQLRSTWENVLSDLVSHLRLNVKVVAEAGGQPTISLDVSRRSAPVEEQRVSLAEALDAIDRLAEAKGRTIAIVLDEFQEIHRFGGEDAEWHLRGVIQGQKNVSYVVAGSRESLILEMTGQKRAFFKLFELMPFGPIAENHMERWIESRMESHGVEPAGCGRRIIELARPRTRDIVQLARAVFQLGAATGTVEPESVSQAFDQIVDEEHDLFLAEWERQTALQQNVLRAISAGEEKLFSEAVREQYGLRGTSYVAAALDSLIERDLVNKRDARYAFDSPFLRRWVARHALPDVGIIVEAVSDGLILGDSAVGEH